MIHYLIKLHLKHARGVLLPYCGSDARHVKIVSMLRRLGVSSRRIGTPFSTALVSLDEP